MTYAEQIASQAVSIEREMGMLRRYAQQKYGRGKSNWPPEIIAKLSYLRAQIEAREEELGARVAA